MELKLKERLRSFFIDRRGGVIIKKRENLGTMSQIGGGGRGIKKCLEYVCQGEVRVDMERG